MASADARADPAVFVVAPGLVGASTLAARRWGLRLGGLVSAFPAIVGPLVGAALLSVGRSTARRCSRCT